MDAWSRAERAWTEVSQGVRLVTPAGTLNTRAQAEAVIQAALPALAGPEWSKARRVLACPELLTFLDRVREALAAAPAPAVVVKAAVDVEGLRRGFALKPFRCKFLRLCTQTAPKGYL